METMTLSKINELAKEVLEIEANSILRLKNNIGEEFDKAILKNFRTCSGFEFFKDEEIDEDNDF